MSSIPIPLYNLCVEETKLAGSAMFFEPSSLPTFEPGEYTDRAAANADPDSWVWDPHSEAGWKLAQEHWQAFSKKWYGTRHDPSPSLSLDPLALDQFPPSILVRECYVATFKRVWGRAMTSRGENGVLITGQPGTGKTLFQFYLLVQLLQRKQVVLFTLDGARFYLFYHEKVYTIHITSLHIADVGRLPERRLRPSNVFIWSLFDIEEDKKPALFLVSPPCLPVQTASPNPSRYKTWDKRRGPLRTGFPLWTRDELAQGLQHQPLYNHFLDVLRNVCDRDSSEHEPDLLGPFSGTSALLDELQEDNAPLSAEEVRDHILDEAIDRFGYSAGDVFSAVFDYEGTMFRHLEAFSIKFADLQNAVTALANGRLTPDISHRILALCPVYSHSYSPVTWKVGFKSDWVARCVMKELGNAEDAEIRRQISLLQRIPQATGMAGYFLEPFAHRRLSESVGDHWPLFSMTSHGTDSPRFTTDQNAFAAIRFAKVKRKIIKFDSVADLSTDLENNVYYIPVSPICPLLDAFTVAIDPSEKSAILWIIQITTARSHGGSALGYQKIRSIVASLKELLGRQPPKMKKKKKTTKGDDPFVEVRYLLVSSKGGHKNLEWSFPKGWNKNCQRDDHRGNVYCLEMALT